MKASSTFGQACRLGVPAVRISNSGPVAQWTGGRGASEKWGWSHFSPYPRIPL